MAQCSSPATIVATFYRFVTLSDVATLQNQLLDLGQRHGLKGTILLAQEGINATVAGSRSDLDALFAFLAEDSRFVGLMPRESSVSTPPFQRFKVKIKSEIVTLGQPEADPSQKVGTYVPPQEWNALIQDPEVVLVDTRNEYEVEIGSFQRAINPRTDRFRDFPSYVQQNLDPQKHRKVALFCTGGIRCEKATSLLLNQGFESVYHLQGGILSYLETVKPEESLWDGECFVFDERVAVTHGLEPGHYAMCPSCGHPLSEADRQSPAYEWGISCPACVADLTPQKRQRQEMRLKTALVKSV
ncbi:MAG: rhodanese-related sulfurtransferase [Prochlorothrix sp.]|nr:rhodanese-related sulfurtransferase [Prochlorothrix sp.]